VADTGPALDGKSNWEAEETYASKDNKVFATIDDQTDEKFLNFTE